MLAGYDPGDWYCELNGREHRAYTSEIGARLDALDLAGLRRRARDAERDDRSHDANQQRNACAIGRAHQ